MKLIKLTLIMSFLALSACVGLPTTTPAPKLTINAQGVPSHYQVKKGDTISKIATRYGLNWREVANLNNLDDKYTIRQGQWLTLWANSTTNTKRKAITTPVTQPLIIQQNVTPVVIPQPQQPKPQFVYPVPQNSVIVRHFGATNNANVKSEGVWFRSEENAPVVAIADGRVIFVDESSANGIFINIRHTDGLVSEYRFVKQLKVEPNQMVRVGQQIASTKKANSGSVITEFRLSKHGAYIDPMTVLK
ncbi:peptidoglycan DD-metalloendopeptidase family protein [Moraxella oblonga]|uniref:peptidoglycan DD-metalloendopeptidase family protein n=1 Tax=Moraxella oblonga TaxID=200413 RepID=UPI00082C8C64|nr:peptidoglycan DD-metalloendopeptidase family protein [Moraxella oblonga]